MPFIEWIPFHIIIKLNKHILFVFTLQLFMKHCVYSLRHIQLFVTHGLWPASLLWPWILPARILEWVALPSSRGSSQARDQTQVSHTAGRFFPVWATRKALDSNEQHYIAITIKAEPKFLKHLLIIRQYI